MIPKGYITEWSNVVSWQTNEQVEQDLLKSYHEYMTFFVDKPPSRKNFVHNLEIKIHDPEFLGDTTALLRPNEKYNPQEAWDLVKSELIEKI